MAHFFCWFFVCFFGTYNLAQITGRDARARQLVWVVLELAGGVRRAAKWLTASVAKLVTRSDAASATEAEMR